MSHLTRASLLRSPAFCRSGRVAWRAWVRPRSARSRPVSSPDHERELSELTTAELDELCEAAVDDYRAALTFAGRVRREMRERRRNMGSRAVNALGRARDWYRMGLWRTHGVSRTGKRHARKLLTDPRISDRVRRETTDYVNAPLGRSFDHAAKLAQHAGNPRAYAQCERKDMVLPCVRQIVSGGAPTLGKRR